MNYTRDVVVDAAAAAREALICIDAADRRRVWTFDELSDAAARLSGTLSAHGVRRGDTVMTLMGSRVEWVLTLLAWAGRFHGSPPAGHPGRADRRPDARGSRDDADVLLHCLGHAPHEGLWATGDFVERDEDGFLWFGGRADDVIVSSGYRIGPTEVESALASHPAVADAAVVDADDAERGEVVRAVVVLRDGWSRDEALVRDLQRHVKAETAPYKYPRVVEFADALPRTASRKLRRAALR